VLWRLLRGMGLALLGLLGALAGCDNGGVYQRKGGRWHFEDRPMQVADPASFRPLGRHFARDARRGYYREAEVADSDGASFEALSENVARDKQHVYWADTYRKGQEYWTILHQRVSVIAGADPASYQVLPHSYGRDVRRVFLEGQPLAVRDPASFEVLDRSFTRDAQRAYHEGREIAGSDGASFEVIDPAGRYARDRQHVFHTLEASRQSVSGAARPALQVLKGANPASLQVLGRAYARDGQRVWWAGQPVAGVDAASFAVEEDSTLEHDARDARARYSRGVRLDAPPRP
jgi:hypothetical protein